MLEPRRIAARAVAQRMAHLIGETVGQTVGIRTRLETRVSRATRIEVVTEGILTRMLQSDPALEHIGCVVFDEFHERSLNADLGLALCLESQETLREDLRVLVMSATLATRPARAPFGRRADHRGSRAQLRGDDALRSATCRALARDADGAGVAARARRRGRRHLVLPAGRRGNRSSTAHPRGVLARFLRGRAAAVR